MNRKKLTYVAVILLALAVTACSTPEEKAQKYYEKGMALLEENPQKAALEFQNALQIKKTMAPAMYGLALVAERNGDWKGAFGLLNNVVMQDAKHIEATVKLGQIFLAGRQLEKAAEMADKAMALDPNNTGALNLKGALALKANNAKAAMEFIDKSLAIDPKNQDTYVLLATERLLAKDNAKAISFLDKAIDLKEKNTSLHIMKISVLEESGNLPEADKSFKRVLAIAPEDKNLKHAYIQFLVKSNRKQDAEVQLRELVKASPEDLNAKLDVVRFLVATKDAAAGRAELESYVKAAPKDDKLAFALASFYRQQQDSTSEDKLLQQIISNANEPASVAKAKMMIAYKLLTAGKKEDANKLVGEVLNQDPRNEAALLLRATQALEAKKYDDAVVDLRTILRESPENAAAAQLLGVAHEQSGSPELAEEQYLKAYQASKFAAKYTLDYSGFLMRRKQPERAEKVLEDAVSANPRDAVLLSTLAQFKLQKGDQVGAQALVDKAKALGQSATLTNQLDGVISLSNQDFDASIAAFKRAHEADPSDPKPIASIVRTYVDNGKKAEAMQFVDDVLKKNPEQFDVLVMKGQLYATQGDASNAIKVFTQLVEKNPQNPVAYQQLAMTQQMAKQTDAAEKTVQQGLAAMPGDFNLQLLQAGVYETTNRAQEAIKVYEKLHEIRPDSVVVINNLASLLSERSDQASLKRAFELAKPLKESGIPQFLDTYAWASFKVGDMAEAETVLKQVIEKMPDVPVYQYHLGKIYAAKGDKVLAKQALQKAIKIAGNKPFDGRDEASQLLKSL